MHMFIGYIGYRKLVCQFTSYGDCSSYFASTKNVHHQLLPTRQLSTKKGFLPRLFSWFCFLSKVLAGKASCHDCLCDSPSCQRCWQEAFLPAKGLGRKCFLPRLSLWFSFLPKVLAGRKITQTVMARSLSCCTAVSSKSKKSRTVSAEAKYDTISEGSKNWWTSLYPVKFIEQIHNSLSQNMQFALTVGIYWNDS